MSAKAAERQDAIANISSIPKDRIAALLRLFSDQTEYRKIIGPPHPSDQRLQGDVHDDFPSSFVAEDGTAKLLRTPAIVLNNSCDLEPGRKEFVVIAPLADFDRFATFAREQRGSGADGFLNDVKSNGVYHLVWLPPFASFKSGAVVFLERIASVAALHFERSIQNKKRLASLRQNGHYSFLVQIIQYLARRESPEVSREE